MSRNLHFSLRLTQTDFPSSGLFYLFHRKKLCNMTNINSPYPVLRYRLYHYTRTEAHLSIPEKFRRTLRIFFFSFFKILCSLFYRCFLLGAHLEIEGTLLYILCAVLYCYYSSFDIVYGAAEQFAITDIYTHFL